MIIRTTILPKHVIAITIFPFIFTRSKDPVTLNHERIHLRQQRELFVIFFFLLYLVEAVANGYKNISFEKEAYAHENDMDYLKNRRAFAWVKFL